MGLLSDLKRWLIQPVDRFGDWLEHKALLWRRQRETEIIRVNEKITVHVDHRYDGWCKAVIIEWDSGEAMSEYNQPTLLGGVVHHPNGEVEFLDKDYKEMTAEDWEKIEVKKDE